MKIESNATEADAIYFPATALTSFCLAESLALPTLDSEILASIEFHWWQISVNIHNYLRIIFVYFFFRW